MAIRGSVEIVRGNETTGVTGVAWEPSAVPVVMGALYGITGLTAQTPQSRPTGAKPLHQWKGKDAQQQEVLVLLWKEIPHEETLAAQIGPGLAGGLNHAVRTHQGTDTARFAGGE